MSLFHFKVKLALVTASTCVSTVRVAGPVVSAVIHQFGCRTSMMSGAILTTAALVLCRFSPNIDVFIFFFGIAGGKLLPSLYTVAAVSSTRQRCIN